jgi:LysM repeat protein
MGMALKSLLFPIVPALALVAFTSPALHAADLEKEYQTMRAVALRDPKVKAAYAEADRKLEAKIVQLDPALAGYRSHGASSEPERTATAPKAAVQKAASTPKPVTHAKEAPRAGGFHPPQSTATASAPAALSKHSVAKGETLGGIASHYGVTVAALKSTNHIADEKKLSVGQVLTIPAKKSH